MINSTTHDLHEDSTRAADALEVLYQICSKQSNYTKCVLGDSFGGCFLDDFGANIFNGVVLEKVQELKNKNSKN